MGTHTLLRQRSDLGGPVLCLIVNVSVDFEVAQGLVVEWYRTSQEAVGISLGGAPPMMAILNTLCRVDRSICIAASVDMDIPMTYASLD
jgi:hypothetical protein